MRKVLLAILMLLPTAANAEVSALLCLFEPAALRFNIINQNGTDLIQWSDKPFQAVVLNVDDKYLTIKQYGTTATFKAVVDIKTLKGYGGVFPFKGEKIEGGVICATD